jgi:hypothetical protein
VIYGHAKGNRIVAHKQRIAASKKHPVPGFVVRVCACGCGAVTPLNIYRRITGETIRRHAAWVPGHQWKGVKLDPLRDYGRRAVLRGPFRKVYGEACLRCGWDYAAVDIAHIRPGGRLIDVVALCPNCHRMFDGGKIDVAEILALQQVALEQAASRLKQFNLPEFRRAVEGVGVN